LGPPLRKGGTNEGNANMPSSSPAWAEWYVRQAARPGGGGDAGGTNSHAAAQLVHGDLRRLGLPGASADRQPQVTREHAAADARRREYDAAFRRRVAAELSSRRDARERTERVPLSVVRLEEFLEASTFACDEVLLSSHECAICTHAYVQGERCVRLPCSKFHQFHRTCLASWLSRQGTCPLCRTLVAMGGPSADSTHAETGANGQS
jgi:hypothetical protein